MRLKKNEAALGMMTLILIGTTITSAYYGVTNSRNVKARANAEQSLLDTEKKLKEKQDGNDQLLNRISSLSIENQQLQNQRDELSLSLKNYQEMVERGAAKSDQSVPLRIAQKNLQDLQRRNQEYELFAEKIRQMVNVRDNEAALAVFNKLINGEQAVIDPRGQIAKTGEATDKAADTEAKEAANEAPQLVGVTPPAAKTQSQKPNENQSDPESVGELQQKIVELSKMVTKRERLLREQGELIERLKSSETSIRIQTAKPRTDDTSANSDDVTTNQGFRSGSGVTASRVITSVAQDDADIITEAFFPAADNVPGIEAFDAILQPYTETIILP